MSDYIDREYLVNHIHACMENDRLMKTATKEEILQMVADTPSVQPEQKKGKWIKDEGWNFCSICGEQTINFYNFCPNCGADMRGEQDETD